MVFMLNGTSIPFLCEIDKRIYANCRIAKVSLGIGSPYMKLPYFTDDKSLHVTQIVTRM